MIKGTDIKFSVVIPTYNRARLVERAITSVLQQRFQPNEIIVVDDGSTDQTKSLVSKMGQPVQYVYQENSGAAVARDRGIRLAQGQWVALLDSDDMWQPDHLARMANAIGQTNGDARFYFGDTQQPKEKGGGSRWKAVGFMAPSPFQLNPRGADWVLINPQPMMLQSTVFNKAAYQLVGGFLPALRYRDDTHLFFRLGLDGPICAVPGISTQMTSDDVPTNRLSLTYDQKLEGTLMHIILFEDLIEKLPDLPIGVYRELKRRLANNYLALARHNWHKQDYLVACKKMMRCLQTHPAVFSGSVKRNLEKVFQ